MHSVSFTMAFHFLSFESTIWPPCRFSLSASSDERIGRVLMKTFLEYYTITGVIPTSPDLITKELQKKKKQKKQRLRATAVESKPNVKEKTPRNQFVQPSQTVLGEFKCENDTKTNYVSVYMVN